MQQARVPVGWKLTSNAADKTRVSMEDSSDEDFFLSATISGGIVTFGIATEAPGKRSPVRGQDLFQLMIDHFGPSNIQALRGRWRAVPGASANLDTFNRLTTPPSLATEEQAALETFTGKMAARKLGFFKVSFVPGKRIGAPGHYTEVEVDFAP